MRSPSALPALLLSLACTSHTLHVNWQVRLTTRTDVWAYEFVDAVRLDGHDVMFETAPEVPDRRIPSGPSVPHRLELRAA